MNTESWPAPLRSLMGLNKKKPDDEVVVAKQEKPVKPINWWTPWSWTDTHDVYFGDDGAWVYRMLPLPILNGDGLDQLFGSVSFQGVERQIHLLLHAWSAPTEAATLRSTGTDLDNYLESTVTLHSPVRRVILGVKLEAAGKKISTLDSIYQSVDTILGEFVPDYELYDADREAVDAWLKPFGATRLDPVALAQLEAWYTLGHWADVSATEEDTYVRMSNGASLNFATANPDMASHDKPPAPPVPPAAKSAVCASARATVLGGKKPGEKYLSDVSVIYGRRAVAAGPWLNILRATMPAANPAGVPLRQLPALDETLPCSVERLNPSELVVDISTLAQAGFINPSPVGDPGGLLLGMGGIGYTDIIRFNPLADTTISHIVGGSIAGKTFLAEHLAYQANLAGITVRYLSADGDSGRIFATSEQPGFVDSVPGMLDPGPLPDQFGRWRRAALAGIASATPQVDTSVFEAVAARTSASGQGKLPALSSSANMIVDPKQVAVLRRAAAQRDTVAWGALNAGHEVPVGTAAWSVPHLLRNFIEDYGTRSAATELLICTALLRPAPPDSAGVLVVVDGIDPGPLVSAALEAAGKSGMRVGMLVCTDKIPESTSSGVTIVGDGLDPQKLMIWAGMNILNKETAGARKFAVIDDDNTIQSAATMTVVDRHGRMSPLVVAPVHETILGALARSPKVRYR